jgi:hypothetical protein
MNSATFSDMLIANPTEERQPAIMVFSTSVDSHQKIELISSKLTNNKSIYSWSIDTADVDNVLRIVSVVPLAEQEVVDLIESSGFICTLLPD